MITSPTTTAGQINLFRPLMHKLFRPTLIKSGVFRGLLFGFVFFAAAECLRATSSGYGGASVSANIVSIVPVDATHVRVDFTASRTVGDLHWRPSAMGFGYYLVHQATSSGSSTTSVVVDPGPSGTTYFVATWVVETFGVNSTDRDYRSDAYFVTRGSFWGPDTQSGSFSGARYLGRAGDFIYDPVNSTTGEFYADHTDLRLSGPMPIEVRRTYSSRNQASNEFGYGWLFNYTSYLIPAEDLSTIQAADTDGSVIVFRRQGTTDVWLPGVADNPESSTVSQGLANVYTASITRTISGADTLYRWKLPDGSTRDYRVRQFPVFAFSRERPYLEKCTDNRGNYQTFTYGTVTTSNDYGRVKQIDSSSGTSVAFTYDTGNRITQAAAADGRTVNYTYNAAGDLTQVQLPDAQVFAYEYSLSGSASTHLLSKETKPEGRILENAYDSSRRVTQQKSTVGTDLTPVINATFDYSVSGKTKVKDAFNNETIYEYTGGLVTKITDPLGRTTIKEWYTTTDTPNGAYQRSLKKITDPRGLVTEYKYDAAGNVIETKLTGDLDGISGTTETATTTTAYNSLNQPSSVTDPAGITTELSYADTNYPYLPTQIVTKKSASTIRTDKLEYTEKHDSTKSSRGLLLRKTMAFGAADQAVMEFDYSVAGFMTQQIGYTGTADPNVATAFTYNARGELTDVVDADGRRTVYTYDAMSRPLTKVVKDEGGSSLGTWTTTYNGLGEMIKVDGPRSGPEDWVLRSYDGAGRLKQEQFYRAQAKSDGSGVEAPSAQIATTDYVHDLFGNLVKVTDPRGNATKLDYDAAGQLTTKKAFAGTNTAGTPLRTELFEYEAGGSISKYTNPLGGISRTFYTATGRQRRQENPDGSILEWRYYTDGRLQKEILRNGSFWETVYDDLTRTATRTLKKSDNTVLASEIRSFDHRGNLVEHTNVEGFTSSTAYDGLDRVKTSTGPAAIAGSARQITTFLYGASSQTFVSQNDLGEKTVTVSDALGRPVQVQVKSSGGTVIRTTAYSYSSDHNSVTVTEGSGGGAIARTLYTDAGNRPLLTRLGDGKFSINGYDSAGNLTTSTDFLGQTTGYAYDALNQVNLQTLPDASTIAFTHDAAGNLTSRAMAGGNLTAETTYDNASRRTTARLYSPSATTRQYAWQYYTSGALVGLLQQTTDPRSTVTPAYDDFLRLQTITTDGSAAGTDSTTSYAYDKRGLVTSISQSSPGDAAGPATQVSRSYDGYGQMLSETVTVGGAGHSSVAQTWDSAGRRASLNEAGSTPSAPLFAYQYRADEVLTRVSANGQNYDFTYADNGLLSGRTNSFRTLAVNSRDAVGRILQQTNTVGSQSMVETMTWRDDSKLNSYSVARSGVGAWNESRAYAYNSRGQLTSEGFSPAPGQSATLNYAFDGGTMKLGVRLDAKVGSGAPAAWQSSATTVNSLARVTEDSTNAAGRSVASSGYALGANRVEVLVDGSPVSGVSFPGPLDNTGQWTANPSVGAGAHTMDVRAIHPSGQYTASASSTFTASVPAEAVASAYDAAGNVTARTWAAGLTQTLTWDAFNRLIKVVQRDGSDNGYNWTAVYDGLGRRLKTEQQTVVAGAASGAAVATTSIYDPQVEFLEIGVAVNGAKAWKVYGPDLDGGLGSLQGTGGLEATIVEGGATKGVLSDRWGNGVASVSSGGAVSWFATRVSGYGPLPGVSVDNLTDITHLAEATAWRSRRIDPSGFIYLGARYYEPTSGRFLSADPAGHAASMSLYDYCNGDPVNCFDSDGRCSEAPGSEDPSWTVQDRLAAGYAQKVYGQDGVTGGLLKQKGIPYSPKDGFAAALYLGPDGKYYLAMRGTEPRTLSDWKANITQELGISASQYNQAVSLATMVYYATGGKGNAADNDSLVLVGHSLGGGLASAGSNATNLPAITFNAEGLSEQYNSGYPGDIRAHYIKGDILSTAQDYSPMPDAIGTRIAHPAPHWYTDPLTRHFMSSFDGL